MEAVETVECKDFGSTFNGALHWAISQLSIVDFILGSMESAANSCVCDRHSVKQKILKFSYKKCMRASFARVCYSGLVVQTAWQPNRWPLPDVHKNHL